jgi:hypothetical protein
VSDDISKLSDEDLVKIAIGQGSGGDSGAADLSGLSEAELRAAAGLPEQHFYDKAPAEVLHDKLAPYVVPPVAAVGRFVDRYVGAPTRAGHAALQDGNNPFSAFWDQFGHDPENAPTGKDIAKKAGLSDKTLSDAYPGLFSDKGEWYLPQKGGNLDVSPAGVAGLGFDITDDWTNAIPPLLLAKEAAGAAKAAAPVVAKATAGAADLATGTEAATKTVRAAEEGGKLASDAVSSVVNPKVNPEWPKLVQIARRNGIPPETLSEALEFGPESFISRSTRNVAEGPVGQALLEKHNEGLNIINEAAANKVQTIGGGKLPANAAEAGALLKKAHEDAMKSFFDGIDLTYDSVQKYAPGLRLDREAADALSSKLNGIERQAKGFISRGDDYQRAYGQQLMRLVNSARQASSFKQFNELRQWIGKNSYARDSQGLIRDMYHGLNDALESTVRTHVNPDFADEILANNKSMSDFFKENSKIVDTVKGGKVADETVFNRLFSNTRQVAALQNILGPQRMRQLKGAYLQSLLKFNSDGTIAFGSTLNSFRRNAPVMSTVFSPKELGDISDIMHLGNEYGPAILSSSGTGASGMFKDLRRGVSEGLMNRGVIDKMKERARTGGAVNVPEMPLKSGELPEAVLPPGAPTPPTVPPPPPGMPPAPGAARSMIPSIPSELPPELREYAKRFLGFRQNGTAQRLKGAQVFSASKNDQQRKRRMRALGE